MSDNKTPPAKKSISADWLVRGVLTRIGQTFDKLTGRDWKPSSSLATSELIERLKKLLDAKVRDLGEQGRFVPHNIKLKMQWDKFSADAEDALRKLQYELHAAAIDHINDNRYHTYAPIQVEVKPDYFTEGVNLMASFDKFAEEDEPESAIKLTMPQANLQHIVINEPPLPEPEKEKFVAEFKIDNKEKAVELEFEPNKRQNVGRTKENDLTIEDPSVSKVHASLMLNAENQLMIADTGSTNGTFINGQRMAYGKAFVINDQTDKVKFGTVEVFFRRVPKPVDFATRESYATDEADFQTEQVTARRQDAEKRYTTNQNYQTTPGEVYQRNETQPPDESFKTNQDYKTDQSFKTNQDFKTNVNYPVGGADENKENNSNDSQVFQTNQRVRLDFGDGDGENKS